MRGLHTLLAAVALAAALAGCAGDEPAESTSSSSPSATQEPSPTEPTPTTEPASGDTKSLRDLTMTFPEGWTVKKVGTLTLYATDPDDPTTRIEVGAFENMSRVGLDALARQFQKDALWEAKPRREDDVEVGGVSAYHLSGKVAFDARMDAFGGESMTMEFLIRFTSALPGAQRQELIDSVLAGVTFD